MDSVGFMEKHKTLPSRRYTGKDRQVVSFRLPGDLVKELNVIAEKVGWTLTDVVQTALDQYVQWEKTNKKAKD